MISKYLEINIIFTVFLAMVLYIGTANAQDVIENNDVDVVEAPVTETIAEIVEVPVVENQVTYDKDKLEYFLLTVGKEIAAEPLVSGAIAIQNEKHKSIGMNQILDLDRKWRADDQNLINETMDSPLSGRLRDYIDDHHGIFTEIFVMDEYGLNVGQTHKTSDYWQGDEDKFQNVYGKGKDAMNIEPAEYDESMGIIQVMTSLPVMHYATGEIVGAIAFAINPDRIP